ncbi:DUF6534 domain-containing protein [Sporobolomyces koalae]|uniref:DUF6534 domain-containing protein n=1 Tax=Sporobolomyces koalae TaxID=500713 RepID=UPI0031794C9C
MEAKPRDLYITLAPLLVGTALSCIAAGLVLSLAITYFTRFNADRLWLRASVLGLSVLAFLGSGFDVSWYYSWSVTHFIHAEHLEHTPWELAAYHFLNGLVVMLVQHLYLFKCWISSGGANLVVTVLTSTLSFASFGVSVYVTALLARHDDIRATCEIRRASWGWFAGVLAVDLFIFVTMLDRLVFRPRIEPRAIPQTKSISLRDRSVGPTMSWGRKLSLRIFHTNILPMLVQIVVLAVYATCSDGLQYLVFAFFAPKIYVISFLATLNFRSPHGNGVLDPIDKFTFDRFQCPLSTVPPGPSQLGGPEAQPVRIVVQHEQRVDRTDEETLDSIITSTSSHDDHGFGGRKKNGSSTSGTRVVTPYTLSFDGARGRGLGASPGHDQDDEYELKEIA